MELNKIGVIGAGTMGYGVTIDLVLHGFSVVLVDNSEHVLESAREKIGKEIRFAPLLLKSLKKISIENALKQIEFTSSIYNLQSCDYIIENATEDWEIKKGIYTKLDNICPPHVCFGADTSCLSITKIASVTTRPDKIVGIHFMNPSYLKPVIEVMKGYHTSADCLKITNHLLSKLNKEAIIVNDFPGFVSNRISHLFMNESAFVLQDGVASADQIDNIFKKCFGHKMGPLETADLIGLDTVVKSLNVLYNSYQDPKFRVCPLLQKMVDAGLHGRKSGKGFYKYQR